MSSVVVLFYRYFLPTPADASGSGENESNESSVINEATLQFFQKHASTHYLPKLQKHQHDLYHELTRGSTIKGRLLISKEGINGTLSFPTREELKEYMTEMEAFDLIRDLGVPPTLSNDKDSIPKIGGGRIFTGIDWKISTIDDDNKNNHRGPFPDLKIQIVKEIVNTGGAVHLNDIPNHGGKEISPKEFHRILIDAEDGKQEDTKKKEVVLIDVRNTFEHAIGHFLHPKQENAVVESSSSIDANDEKASSSDGISSSSNTIPKSTPAINPNTVTFSHFDSTFCSQNADSLKDKKVLMYCTGGIRCVKASAMLKQRGVEDVSHLSGGIHRYVEEYGSEGFYKGKVFVFDQRVALDPDSMASVKHDDDDAKVQATKDEGEKVVGKCIECATPYDQISGATLCTVCRDLILLCRSCKSSLNEFHCERHQPWKSCYFTFLERYSLEELTQQRDQLQKLHDTKYVPPKEHKNVRKTLRKQMDKVLARIRDIQTGEAAVDKNAKRRCRTCFDPEDVCDGLCWGFWRSLQSPIQKLDNDGKLQPIMEVGTGDRVTPGPDWNTLRHGKCFRDLSPEPRPLKRQRNYASDEDKQSTSNQRDPKVGTVVEVKSWASGGTEMDCVSVLWDADRNQDIICEKSRSKRKSKCGNDDSQVQSSGIYRWGAIARNGRRMYDVKLVSHVV